MSIGEKITKELSLHYTNLDVPGFSRKANANTFIYRDKNGKIITDKKILQRITNLKIPPAWENVWISPSSQSHIQAVGIDEKNRKQYIYHPDWISYAQETKFHRMLFFSNVLPNIRQQIKADLSSPGLSQKKVLATIIWLLEHTYIRIGNKTYAKENKHYGLTTLRNKHILLDGQQITFRFIGKSGKEREVHIEHPQIAKTIRKLESLPGYELFQYLTTEGKRHTVTSDEVNEYLHTISGDTISAKDFRTWGATVLSAKTLYKLGESKNATEQKKNITQAVKIVAKQLGNTPHVARTYYIHPAIPNTYQKHLLIPHFRSIKKKPLSYLSFDEYAVKTLLQEYMTVV